MVMLSISPVLVSQTNAAYRYLPLGAGEGVKLVLGDTTINISRPGNQLVMTVSPQPAPEDWKQDLEPKRFPQARKWGYVLMDGELNSTQWQKSLGLYSVEVETPVGTCKFNKYIFWNAKDKQLMVLPPGKTANTIERQMGVALENFQGNIIYRPQSGLILTMTAGGMELVLTSGEAILLQGSGEEFGVQFSTRSPFTIEAYDMLTPAIKFIKSQQEDVRNVTPGQS